MKNNLRKMILMILVLGIATAISYSFDEESEVSLSVSRGSKVSKKKLVTDGAIYMKIIGKNRKLISMSEVFGGDQFAFNFVFNKQAYLYIINYDLANMVYPIFPHRKVERKSLIQANETFSFPPANGDLAFEFSDKEGLKIFYIIASTQKIPYLEKLTNELDPNGTPDYYSIKSKLEQFGQNSDEFIVVPSGKKADSYYFKKVVLINKGKKQAISPELSKKANNEVQGVGK